MENTPEAADLIMATWQAQFDSLHESASVRELKAWLLQVVLRIELGYNPARIFYTYP
jgi:hypothetical protein